MEPHETLEARRSAGAGLAPAPGGFPAAGIETASPEERAALEPLAESVTVVQEGWDSDRLSWLAMAAVAVLTVIDGFGFMHPPGAAARIVALTGAGCVAAGWLLRRWLRYRHEFTVGPEGVSLWRSNPRRPEDEFRLIPWTGMVTCWMSVDHSEASMSVVSTEGHSIDLDEKPPRPETLEFLRRFRQEAMRHPRAELRPRDAGATLGVRTLAYTGAAVAVMGASFLVRPLLDVPPGIYLAGFVIFMALYQGVQVWLQLDDSDVAHADRGGRSWKARMRNRLRELLGIRHV